jgi:plastocyanin
MNRYLIGLCALFATASCGGGDAAAPKPAPTPKSSKPAAETPAKTAEKAKETPAAAAAKSGSQEWSAALGTATVSGRVKFDGPAPERKVVNTDADPKCHAAVAEPLVEESVVVNDGGLANVVVSISKGADGFTFAKGSGTVRVEQKGCRYIPHVIAMQAGQQLSISNDDDTVHNVHSYSKRNQSFNQAQPAGSDPLEKSMDRKDALFPIKCDMHSWMNCNVVVFDHPFFTVSDAKGAFTLPKLPAGTYTLTAEHETLGKKETTVTVAGGGTAKAEFTFTISQ